MIGTISRVRVIVTVDFSETIVETMAWNLEVIAKREPCIWTNWSTIISERTTENITFEFIALVDGTLLVPIAPSVVLAEGGIA
jgi:hypothetical protein